MNRLALLTALTLVACGGGEPGTVEITIYGEAFIEEGIPAAEVSDGWAVTFDKFLVSVGDVTAAAGHGDPAIDDPTYRVFDLAIASGGAGHPVVAGDAGPGHYDHVGYVIAHSADAVAGNADPADVAALVAGGYAIRIIGSATDGTVTKTFDWAFAVDVLYDHCHSEAHVDGTDERIELTIHGDHLLYDDLTVAEPDLAFAIIAGADADDDGVITQAELAAVDISAQARYQTGTDIDDLWSYLEAAMATLGHIDGEGHCDNATRL
jgi:hypothetical protein